MANAQKIDTSKYKIRSAHIGNAMSHWVTKWILSTKLLLPSARNIFPATVLYARIIGRTM